MQTFEITIQRAVDGSWPVVALESDSDGALPLRHEGQLSLDRIELLALTSPLRYGTCLGQALFHDTIRDAFVAARREAEDGLRVLLFVEAPDLRDLHWERLCAPDHGGWDHLALGQRALFSLYLPSLADRRFPPIGRLDLRALVVAASPDGLDGYGLKSFDVDATVAGLRAALGEIPVDVLATGDGAVGPPTLDAVVSRLSTERYTLLHVVCHGAQIDDRVTGQRETTLYLARADHGVDAVNATRLLSRLRGLDTSAGLPYLAFLSTCESASPKAEAGLGGLGQRLVRDLGLPAVVAMTEPVTIATSGTRADVFYRQLRRHGEVDRALAEASAGLAERRDATISALFTRLGARPLFSDTRGVDALTNREVAHGLDRLDQLLPERGPGLLNELAKVTLTLRGLLATDPSALRGVAAENRTDALRQVGSICAEALELDFAALAQDEEPPAYNARCPFLGLKPFQADDRDIFFGRTELVKTLVNRLDAHGFLAVLGRSGSGKSSVVLAGLVPALRQREPALKLAYCTPGAEPLAALDASLKAVGDAPAVVVVDQFEELFTLCTDPGQRRAFAMRLLDVAANRRLILTMRADFWGECDGLGTFTNIMQACQKLIEPLDAQELRAAMEQQAEQVKLRFEADLASTILDDVQGEPAAMPLLQHALLELWHRRHGRWLRSEEYRAIGGVQQAITHTAETVYQALGPEDQARVRSIFLRLTRLDEDSSQGDARRDTRRRVTREELVPAGDDPSATIRLVTKLADASLLVTSVNPSSRYEEVEVAHEALIRHWPRLLGWLEADRELLLWRQRLGADLAEWKQAGEVPDSLLRGGRLLNAARWLGERPGDLSADERRFIQESLALQQREQEAELAAARERADLAEARTRAEEDARRTAEEAQLRAQQDAGRLVFRNRLLATASVVAVVLTLATLVLWGGAEANRRDANTAREEAEASAQEAQAQATVAAVAQAAAEANAAIATTREEQTKEANRIARSRELAAWASLQLRIDPELSLLLATEAAEVFRTDQAAHALRQALVLSHVRATMRGHQSGITSAVFSPDGSQVLTASLDNTASIWESASGRRLIELRGHTGWLKKAAFSPDGRLVVTASWGDNTARVWQASTGVPVADLRGHTGPITTTAFSPDSNRLVTASLDHTARVWEAETGQHLAELRGHIAPVDAAEFRHDGVFIVTGGQDNTARIWDVKTGQSIAELRGHTGWVNDVSFSPDGRLIVTAGGDAIPFTPSRDHTARIWDAESGRSVAELRGHTNRVTSAAFSPNGRHVLTASWDGTARLWDLQTGRTVHQFPHAREVSAAGFSPDGRLAVTASNDGSAFVWALDTGRNIAELRGHSDRVAAVAFSPDSRRVVTASQDGTARVWEPLPAGAEVEMHGHQAAVMRATYSPDGKLVLTAGLDGDNSARVWEASTGRHVQELRAHSRGVIEATFNPDGQQIVTASFDGTARLWGTATGESIAELRGHRNLLTDATFSPDGKLVATASYDGTVRVWSADTGVSVSELRGHGARVNGVAFSPDGQLVVTASADNTARVWQAAAGTFVAAQVGHNSEVLGARFSPDGQLVATTSRDNTARVWQARTGTLVAELRGHTDTVYDASFSPDGRLIATASGDRTARVWQPATGIQTSELRGHEHAVNAARFSSDGGLIVTASTDKTARIWTTTGQGIAELRGHAGAVFRASFNADGTHVLTASEDKTARIFPCLACGSIDVLLSQAKSRGLRSFTAAERRQYFEGPPTR